LLRSVDPTDARKATVRRFGRSDRSAQGDRSTLRSITPKRATTSLAASVDHTEAHCAKARLAPSVRLATPVQSEDQTSGERRTRPYRAPLFVLAHQHRRWELTDLAGRLDSQPAAVELCAGLVPAPAREVSGLSPNGRCMLPANDELPEDEREVFEPVWIDGMTQAEAAHVLGVSEETVKRRLNRGLRLRMEQLADLRPGEKPPDTV
jgi:DNA-directed RNA polymerase specialized sigma24 family protein